MSNNEDNYKIFLCFIYYKVSDSKEKLESKKTFISISEIESLITFFMISPLSIPNQRNYLQEIFKGDFDFFHKMTDLCLSIKFGRAKEKALEILQNFFFNDYKKAFSNADLVELFSSEMINFTAKFTSLKSNLYQTDTYVKMYQKLKNFEISYENFFANNSEIPADDRPTYKLKIAQSVIRVAFSLKKKKSYSDANEEGFDEYQFIFLSKVVEKDISETRKKYCDDFKTLFRKEDLCDDIIKYIFFLFGNETLVEAFLNPYNKFLLEIEDNNRTDFTLEEFSVLMESMIKNIKDHLPLILKIILKLVHNNVMKYFTIEEDNYSPLYTLLFFNFLMTPRMQIVHGLDPKSEILRKINRLVRNCCYNTLFNEGDPLNVYNEEISKFKEKLQEMMKSFIEEDVRDEEHIKEILKNFYIENFIEYPLFLFYNDSKFLCDTIEGGVGAITYFESIDVLKSHRSEDNI
ncbi:MAG: hypothetical protein MJ252_10720 [archaeon]|nr:hypothetical protein [archaeon]